MSYHIQYKIVGLIIFLGLFGHTISATLSVMIGIESTYVSVFFRALTLLLSILLILFLLTAGYKTKLSVGWLFLFIFIFVYSFQIILWSAIEPHRFLRDVDHYLIWLFLVCLIPSFSVSYGYKQFDVYSKIFFGNGTLVFLLILTVLSLFYSDTLNFSLDGNLVDIGRLHLDALNPISYGHFAVTIIIYCIVFFKINVRNSFMQFVALLVACTAFYIVILTNSRGPVLSLVVVITALLIKFYSRYYLRRSIAVPFFIVFAAVGIYFLSVDYIRSSNIDYIDVFSRLVGMLEGNFDLSSNERMIAWSSSLSLIKENYLFGGYLEDPVTKFYPHNIFIEAVMSVGIVFSLFFIFCLFYLFFKAFSKSIVSGHELFVSLVYIQYFIAAQFSGAIYSWQQLWLSIGLMLALSTRYAVYRAFGHNTQSDRSVHISRS